MRKKEKHYYALRYRTDSGKKGEMAKEHESLGEAITHAVLLRKEPNYADHHFYVVSVAEYLDEDVCSVSIEEAEAMGMLPNLMQP